jgi:L-threonylcarbamoyladenylate synthase
LIQKNIPYDKARELLVSGEVVAIPTETVYGLAANALDKKAVARIFEIKQRPSFDPLIVHVPGFDAMKNIVISIPERLEALVSKFAPGPLTVVLKKSSVIPDIVTSGLDTVGIRIPNHPIEVWKAFLQSNPRWLTLCPQSTFRH